MNKSPYITNKSLQLKERLRIAIKEHGLNEFILADQLGIKPPSVQVLFRKIDRPDLNYQTENIMRINIALDHLGIPRINKGE